MRRSRSSAVLAPVSDWEAPQLGVHPSELEATTKPRTTSRSAATAGSSKEYRGVAVTSTYPAYQPLSEVSAAATTCDRPATPPAPSALSAPRATSTRAGDSRLPDRSRFRDFRRFFLMIRRPPR